MEQRELFREQLTNLEPQLQLEFATNELVQSCTSLCEHATITTSDMQQINDLMSKRALISVPSRFLAGGTLRMFLNGLGFINTGGFNFKFVRSNSFDINGNGWSMHISNTALLMVLLTAFSIVAIGALAPGAVIGSITSTGASASCSML